MAQALDAFIHLDRSLDFLVAAYGAWVYAILFLVIFLETGVVVAPFLPGDSLLFAAGAIAARRPLLLDGAPETASLEVGLLLLLFAVAAIAGDALNYRIGSFVGPRAFTREGSRFLKREYLARTERFYAAHGKKTILLARFVPIMRTFAPFVAGMGKMPYRVFASYNVAGGLIWTLIFVLGGYYFGRIPFVERHFSLVILGIIALSLIQPVREFIRSRRGAIVE